MSTRGPQSGGESRRGLYLTLPPFVLLSSESPGRRERLVVSVSEFMPHGEVLVAAAVFKGFISTLRINVRGKTSSVGILRP